MKLVKDLIKVFDNQKTYNKFNCSTNYLGLLGELLFARYLNNHKIYHEWVKFIKQGGSQPDFIINGIEIDLKTTKSDHMWFQEPMFDVYIYAHVSVDEKTLTIPGWTTKSILDSKIKRTELTEVKRGNRFDYVLPQSELIDIRFLNIHNGN